MKMLGDYAAPRKTRKWWEEEPEPYTCLDCKHCDECDIPGCDEVGYCHYQHAFVTVNDMDDCFEM